MACDPDKLRELIEGSGLSYTQNSVSYVFSCPRCGKSKKLYIRKRDGRYVCWTCKETSGYQGRAEYALADLLQRPIKQVQEQLYGSNSATDDNYFDLALPDWFGENDEVDEEATVIPTMDMPFDFFPITHSFSTKGLSYINSRGISTELASEYHLHYSPKDQRVIFPVEIGSRIVGWQARTIKNTRNWNEEKQDYVEFPKMLSSKGVPTAHTVMFSNRLIGQKHAVVCEGPIDAMAAHLCQGNIATMGKAIGKGQTEVIRNPSKLTRREVGQFQNAGIERIYLALDEDASKETTRLVREFSDLEVYVMQAPKPYEDIGAMPLSAVKELFDNARRVSTANIFVSFNTA